MWWLSMLRHVYHVFGQATLTSLRGDEHAWNSKLKALMRVYCSTRADMLSMSSHQVN